MYGAPLNRQSDRDFPYTKYTSPMLASTKKEGSDYAGILLCLIIAMMSGQGRSELQTKALLADEEIEQQIYTLEHIIGMEEFLKHGELKKSNLVKSSTTSQSNLEKMITHFMNQVNANCRRSGMGNNLIKNHLYFHLHKYMEMWGSPAGWDSAPSESNHKTKIKAPSKNTQNNASTFIEQTGKRYTENRLIERSVLLFGIVPPEEDKRTSDFSISGAQFQITTDEEGMPIMKWSKYRNRKKPFHPADVLKFCCDIILPIIQSNVVYGFTEHHRLGDDDGLKYIFRAHPSYRDYSGQACSVWYDWALFNLEEGANDGVPCQILCLLNLTLSITDSFVEGYPIVHDGLYAVVRKFRTKGNKVHNSLSDIVWKGELDSCLYLLHCDTIMHEVAIVQNITSPHTDNHFFWIRNRNYWLTSFYTQMNTIALQSDKDLYKRSQEMIDNNL